MSAAGGPRVRILISSCLLGERVRYDGAAAATASSMLDRWRDEGRLVPFCPEVAGGLPVPRPPAEVDGRDGRAVLDGQARVLTESGADVSAQFLAGARRALEAAREAGARLAILKDGSPSCGSSYIYDGGFQGVRRAGAGVTSALLERNGIRVFNEREIDQAAAWVSREEGDG